MPKASEPTPGAKRVLYYGIGLSGRTTSIEVLSKKVRFPWRGELSSRVVPVFDRELYFPCRLRGSSLTLELFTVSLANYSLAEQARRIHLSKCDAIVFVVDSQPDKLEEQRELIAEVEEELQRRGLDPRTFPIVIQWNKRDLEGALPVDQLARELNPWGAPAFETVAFEGRGVSSALETVVKRLEG